MGPVDMGPVDMGPVDMGQVGHAATLQKSRRRICTRLDSIEPRAYLSATLALWYSEC